MIRRTSLTILLLTVLALPALAGGGPETTLVVVNGNSPVSREVANVYGALRDIPDSHFVYLDSVPHVGVITLDFFLEQIWTPIDAHMKAHGIEDQIDLITYSADFPYNVNFKSRLDKPKPGHTIGGFASLTGVTYLIRHVLAGDPFWNLQINRYFRLGTGGGGGVTRAPTATEQKLIDQAEAALQQKNYADAATYYEKLTRTLKSGTHLYNQACCLARTGRKREALDALSQAVNNGFSDLRLASQDPDLESLRSSPGFRNILSRIQSRPVTVYPGHGFHSSVAWTGAPQPVPNAPATAKSRYYLSTQLGYTGPYGNSLPEVLECLTRAAASDGTRPDGTVYICKNGNVRSTAREPFFPFLIKGMQKLGRKVEILEKGKAGQNGVIPVDKDDVIGAVVGAAGFKWASGKSVMLPGAICEHLTSFGAHFGTPGQTKLSEFIRGGAAGSSGTVVEPLSHHQKFPNPIIHIFYAEGCSLAEAFYQSMWGPFQLLVVGDGLARPFANFETVEVTAPKGDWSGTIKLEPRGRGRSFELWVDGKRFDTGETFTLDTTALEDGRHDVRVVAVAGDDVQTRSYRKLEAVVNNHARVVSIRTSDRKVEYGEFIEVRLTGAKGAKEIQALHHGRVVASSKKSPLLVPSAAIGPGTVSITPRVVFDDGTAWRGGPESFEIVLPETVKAKTADLPTKAGLRGKAKAGGEEVVIAVTNLGDKAGGRVLRDQLKYLKQAEWFELAGEIEVRKEGQQQLLCTGTGKLTLEVAGTVLCQDVPLDRLQGFVFKQTVGWHPIRIRVTEAGAPNLTVLHSGETVCAPPRLRHASHEALKTPPAPAGAAPKKPIAVPGEGLELTGSKTVRNISAIVLTPPAKAEAFPQDWIVEVSSGRNKWKQVKNVTVLVGPGAKAIPQWIELSFKPMKAKTLRVRPRDGKATSLGRVEVLGKPLKQR